MMTRKELHDEFWLLTKGILQDSKVDATEAIVVKRWLEEHQTDNEFSILINKLTKMLSDSYIDRFESQDIILSISSVLRRLRELAKDEAAGAAK